MRPRTRISRILRRLVHTVRKSFTLVELLIVIAIIAIVAVIIILVLNPAQLILQARDSNRFSDMNTLNSALNLFTTDVISGYVGTSTVLYTSVPDPTATTTAGTNCAGVNLPQVPAGYVYHCAASSTVRRVDGTGWIPINFLQMSSRAPFSNLPVDPVNNATSNLYYTYVPCWGTWSNLESKKNISKEVNDGGFNPAAYEVGPCVSQRSNAAAQGLVAWWKFDEGAGNAATDSSGSGLTGQLYNNPSWTTGVLSSALRFTAAGGSYVDFGSRPALDASFTGTTLSMWIFFDSGQTGSSGDNFIAGKGYIVSFEFNRAGQTMNFHINNQANYAGFSYDNNIYNGWHFLVGTFDGSMIRIYMDGTQVASQPSSNSSFGPSGGIDFYAGGNPFGFSSMTGTLDDLRFYNRALSASEVQAIYNATKP